MNDRQKTLRLFFLLCLPIIGLLAMAAWLVSLRLNWDFPPPSQRTLAFRKLVEGVDEVRLRTRGQCHRDPTIEQRLAVWHGAQAREFINALRVTDGETGECMCCGNPSFEFYRNGKLVLTLTAQHGKNLRCRSSPWNGDAPLTWSSKIYLKNVLQPYGKFW